MSYKGKHAKFKFKTRHKAAIVGAVGVAGIGGSVALSGTAHAATMSQWDTVSICESGGDWTIDHGDGGDGSPGSGASAWGGGLQFQPASWQAALDYLHGKGIDTSHFGEHASNSTKDQQILAAEALLAVQPGHPDPWACDPNQNLGASMFLGGPNPWEVDGYTGDTVPQFVLDGTLPSAPPVVTPPPVADPPPAPAPVPDPVPAPVPPAHHDRGPLHHHYHGRHARSHEVVHGDTLWDIARVQLGDGSRWPELYKVSDLRSGDPDLIFPGEIVNLP